MVENNAFIRLTGDDRIVPGEHATGNADRATQLVRKAYKLEFDADDGSRFPKLNGATWIVKCYTSPQN